MKPAKHSDNTSTKDKFKEDEYVSMKLADVFALKLTMLLIGSIISSY